MIPLKEVLQIHEKLILLYGGLNGIRDISGLEAALARPFQTFAKEELYPSAFEKASAIGESIIMNHPFVDGNKRTGYVLLEILLRVEGIEIDAPIDEKYQFVINITTGQMRFDEIVLWLQNNTKSV
jgi:death on curing protein